MRTPSLRPTPSLVRLLRLSIALGIVTVSYVNAIDLAGWQKRQQLEAKTPGLVRVALPTETLSASQPSLADLRLISPTAAEVPYTLEWPMLPRVSAQAVAGFHATLNADHTVLEIVTGSTSPIDHLRLECASSRFIKSASLEGSNDGTNWQTLLTNSMVFREDSGIEQLSLHFPSAIWKQLRVTLDDSRSPPVAFTAAGVRQFSDATATQNLATTIAAREETKGQTRLTLHFAQAHPYLGELKLVIGDALFHRRVHLMNSDGISLASGMLFRTVIDGHEATQLTLPVHRQAIGEEAQLVIDNNDSPPLRIDGISSTRYPIALLFQAESAGSYQLYTGQAQATAPRYDVSALAGQLRNAAANTADFTTLANNSNYSASATLPATGEPGAAAELAEWSRRRLVKYADAGVLNIVLDAEVLSQSQDRLHDLRLLQDGHQLPYIIEAVTDTLEMPLALTPDNDAKQPQLSRWRLGNPSPGLPIQSLEFTTATELFERSLVIWHSQTDRNGSNYRETFPTFFWTRKPGQAAVYNYGISYRIPTDAWFLETDNGDNTALQITSAKLRYATHVLLCRVTNTAPLHLYFANPKATQPRYDIRLIETELRAATKTATSFGDTEQLKPTKSSKPESSGTGSPILWAALAAVVAGLLFAVAKLLPKVDTPTE